MKLLILDGPREPRSALWYRGTYRAHPTHCDALSDTDEINILFSWFIEEGGELGVVSDCKKALRFAELWNARLTIEKHFEVVEVTNGEAAPEVGGSSVGFDISAGYNYSLLSWGLEVPAGMREIDWRVRDLYNLLSRHYRPQLNSRGLFDTAEIAGLCLSSLKALQGFHPNLFESGSLEEFRVTGLYQVRRS
jgi:hypothetical protein